MSLIQCPECGGTLSNTVKFCIHCGSRIGICPACGGVISGTVKFCTHCGCRMSACPECGTRFIESNTDRCPGCGYEIRKREFSATGSVGASKTSGLFSLSSKKLDDAMASWKRTKNPDSTFLGFCSSFTLTSFLFSFLVLLFLYFVGNPLTEALLYPLFWFAILMFAISFPFLVIKAFAEPIINFCNNCSFIRHCKNEDLKISELIEPTIYKLSTRISPLTIEQIDKESLATFHFTVMSWYASFNSVGGRIFKQILGNLVSCLVVLYVFFSLAANGFLLNPFNGFSPFGFFNIIKEVAMHCIETDLLSLLFEAALLFGFLFLIFALGPIVSVSNDRGQIRFQIKKNFPASNDFKGRFRNIYKNLP